MRMQTLADLSDAIDRSVHSVLRGHPALEDALQEAHIEAWRRREADPGTPLGHQLVAARRRAQDVAVGKQSFGAPPRTPGSGSRKVMWVELEAVEKAVELREGQAFVDTLLAELAPTDREVAEMLLDGYRQDDVAHRFGYSKGWVWRRLLAIREALSPHLDDLRVA